jgi:hypothetical protein
MFHVLVVLLASKMSGSVSLHSQLLSFNDREEAEIAILKLTERAESHVSSHIEEVVRLYNTL